MDGRRDEGLRSRRARLRALPTPVDVELYVQDAPPLLEVIDDLPEPRIADLDALLREVDDLRDTLRRDLTLAATAAEAGADDLAGWLLLGDNGQVRAFEERALAHLHELEQREEAVAAPAPARRRRMRGRLLPAAPLVAACAALFGFLGGGLPGLSGAAGGSPSTSNVALSSYAKVTGLATSGASASRISEAAQQFHAELAPLVAVGATDPAAVEKAIALLRSERIVIASRSADSPALRAVLRQADLLVAKLQASLPHRVRRPLVTVPLPPQPQADQARTERKSSSAPKATPAAKPSPTASTAPKPAPKPSGSPTPTPTSTSDGQNPLPTNPLQ